MVTGQGSVLVILTKGADIHGSAESAEKNETTEKGLGKGKGIVYQFHTKALSVPVLENTYRMRFCVCLGRISLASLVPSLIWNYTLSSTAAIAGRAVALGAQ